MPEDDVHAPSLVPSTFVKWFTTAVAPAPPGAHIESDGSVVPAAAAQPLTNPECRGPKTVLPDADDE